MNKYFTAALLALLCACSGKAESSAEAATASDTPEVMGNGQKQLPNQAVEQAEPKSAYSPAAQALIDAYPQFVKDVRNGRVLFADGTDMPFDDGREKGFEERLDNSDIEDMFFVRYQVPAVGGKPEYLADAGRSRSDELFKKMYGSSSAAVQRNLVPVNWFGQTIKFTKINGAADALRAVAADIAKDPEFAKLRPYLKSSGAFFWRPVRGAKRMSAHSYGMAFDIGVDKSDYWLWKFGNGETKQIGYANRIPRRLVEIFERHGFIWGGAWYHFDTMHFEYRPEILRYAELTK